MMKCVGTPNGPCPFIASGACVHFRFAELDLCSPCEKVQREATIKASGGKVLLVISLRIETPLIIDTNQV